MNGWELHLTPDSFELAGTGGEKRWQEEGWGATSSLGRAVIIIWPVCRWFFIHPEVIPVFLPLGPQASSSTSTLPGETIIADKLDLLEAESIWILIFICSQQVQY